MPIEQLTFDLIVPIIHSENLLKKLRDVGATAELITVRTNSARRHPAAGRVLRHSAR